jgi:hypothetical protein
MVGIAISMRIKMIEMTISNSINVKPLSRTERLVRQFDFVQFMGLSASLERGRKPRSIRRKSYNEWTRKGNRTLGTAALSFSPLVFS